MDAASIDQPSSDPPVPKVVDQRLRLLVGGFVALVVCTQIGSILAPTLVNRNPPLLLALSSRIRHLLFAVAKDINPVVYALIGYVRIAIAAVLCYTIGYHYGERGFRWLETQSGDQLPATLLWLQRTADRAGWLLVLLMPGSNVVCALVGQRRMPRRHFATLITIGIAFRLVWVWIAAEAFKSPLQKALDWIDKYQLWLVIAFLGISFLQTARKASRNVDAASSKSPYR